MERRGVSDVVTTVLLVLLTITAVGVLAGVLVPFVKDRLSEGTECLNYKDYFKFEESSPFNCYSHGQYKISVKAESTDEALNETIKGFNLKFIKHDGTSTTAKVLPSGGDVTMMGTGELKIPNVGEWRTYTYPSQESYTNVEVYPVLENGRICDRTDSVTLATCPPAG